MKVFSLRCASCGASLEIPENTDTFACEFCGAAQIVERGGGIVSLRKLEASLDHVKSSTGRTASELALARLASEAAAIEAEHGIVVRRIESEGKQITRS
jgi:hypothetical protein